MDDLLAVQVVQTNEDHCEVIHSFFFRQNLLFLNQVIEIAQKYPPSVLRAAGLIRDTGSIDRQGQDVVLPRGTIYGEDTQVSIGQTKVAAQWAVVDLVDVEAAMTKADNQWRDRTRQASSAQIREISNNPDYDQVQWSPVMDYGAPTLSKDGLVIGGNGRVMGISTSYDIGKVGNYRSRLLAQLDEFGVDPTAIDGMKKPMLVRVLRLFQTISPKLRIRIPLVGLLGPFL